MRCRCYRGMTLVEVLVASAILVIVIAAVGYVYTQTTMAVGVTQARIDINAKIRSVTRQLSDDLRCFTPDGMLAFATPGPSAIAGANPPGVLMFTMTGHFESRTRREVGGQPVTANAALVVYVLSRPGGPAAGADTGYILCRYVYLLTGDGRWPPTLLALAADAAAHDPGDPNKLDGSDVLGESLVDFRRRDRNAIEADYMDPVLLELQSVNVAPSVVDDAVAGGIVQLWPYLVNGCTAMEIEFSDGLAGDGVTASTLPMDWFAPSSDAAARRTDAGGASLRAIRQGMYWMCWRPAVRNRHPIALLVRLGVADVAGRVSPRTCELVVTLRH